MLQQMMFMIRAWQYYEIIYGESRFEESHIEQTIKEIVELSLHFMGLRPEPAWYKEIPRTFEDEPKPIGLLSKEKKNNG